MDLRFPLGYSARDTVDHFVDIPTGLIHQPLVYEMAARFADKIGATSILDIGCGSGLKLAKYVQNQRIIGVDYPGIKDEFLSHNPSSTFIEAELDGKPIQLDGIDWNDTVVVCADVIEHLKEPTPLIKSIIAHQNECPLFLFSTPDRTRIRGIADQGPPHNPCHFHEWSLDELARLFEDCGINDGAMWGHTHNNNIAECKTTSVILGGRLTWLQKDAITKPFKATAIINTYNETDVIMETIHNLLYQGMDVHVFDDWSTDSTYEKINNLASETPRVTLDRGPKKNFLSQNKYNWHRQLENVAEFAKDLDSDWIMHHDADEIRVSPWPGVSLIDALKVVDHLGFNAIDFSMLNFRYLKIDPEPQSEYAKSMTWFELGDRPGHFLRVNGWKQNVGLINLADSGGHDAVFPGRKIFPLNFLIKHYPLRGATHAKRKVIKERAPRTKEERQKRGWHNHYDAILASGDYSGWSRRHLTPWHPVTFYQDFLVERLTGLGVATE